MYLLDTDTIVFSLRGQPVVVENLRKHLNDPIKLSVISCMELYYGAYKSHAVASNVAKVKTLEDELDVIPMGSESAEIFGMLKSKMETAGNRLDDFDLAIAACALTNNLILVTHNIKHFQRIEGLKVTDWTQRG
jgi:tRNA(fMet)-specific endonuclease VapC